MQKYPLFSGFQMAFSIDKRRYGEKETIFFDCEPFMIGKKEVSRLPAKSFEYEPDYVPEGKTILQLHVLQLDEDYL